MTTDPTTPELPTMSQADCLCPHDCDCDGRFACEARAGTTTALCELIAGHGGSHRSGSHAWQATPPPAVGPPEVRIGLDEVGNALAADLSDLIFAASRSQKPGRWERNAADAVLASDWLAAYVAERVAEAESAGMENVDSIVFGNWKALALHLRALGTEETHHLACDYAKAQGAAEVRAEFAANPDLRMMMGYDLGREQGAAEVLRQVGERIEGHRLISPMNHDGSNYMLDKIEKALSSLGPELAEGIAIAVERAKVKAAESYGYYQRLNAPTLAGQEGERDE